MFICHKQRKCLSPEHWVVHSQGVCPGTATHSYVMPYLQSADHMHFQIPNGNYWHYHNHLDTHTAGRASQLADCVQSRAKTPTGWAQHMYCSTYSLPVSQTVYYLITRAALTQTYRTSPCKGIYAELVMVVRFLSKYYKTTALTSRLNWAFNSRIKKEMQNVEKVVSDLWETKCSCSSIKVNGKKSLQTHNW